MWEYYMNHIDNRIFSLSEPWVRLIVCGKQNAEVEFDVKEERKHARQSESATLPEIENSSWIKIAFSGII